MEKTREALFGVLVHEHDLGLRAFVRACTQNAAEADDLVQETFITAWRRLDEYDRARPFAGWLRGIARHNVNAYFRERAALRQHEHVLSPEAVAAIADEFERLNRPPRGEVYRDCFAALRECLETLGGAEREVVHRAYRDNQACRAIAGDLGQTVEAVKKRLQRARAALRDCILSKLEMEAVDV